MSPGDAPDTETTAMRRITMWLTATLAVIAMITYYQVSRAGGEGKHPECAPNATQTGKPGEHK